MRAAPRLSVFKLYIVAAPIKAVPIVEAARLIDGCRADLQQSDWLLMGSAPSAVWQLILC